MDGQWSREIQPFSSGIVGGGDGRRAAGQSALQAGLPVDEGKAPLYWDFGRWLTTSPVTKEAPVASRIRQPGVKSKYDNPGRG